MSALDTEPEATTLALAAVVSAKDIDTKILDAHGRLKALKVGSIDLSGPGEIATLRAEGRRFVARLSAILGVAPRVDVFSSQAHGGAGNYALHG